MYCWDCKHFDYDESYDPESGEEWQIVFCHEHCDPDEINEYSECKCFEEDN